MPFTTVDKIRDECGFGENTNIEDSVFESYQTEANAQIVSIVASRYALPSVSALWDSDPGKITLGLIEKLLTAGMMLNKEFPWDETEEESDGNTKIERAENMLKQIADWSLRLLFADGSEVSPLPTGGTGAESKLVGTNFDCKDFKESPEW